MSVAEAGERIAAAARTLVGARFRLHGRDPALGLDCVGVAVAALREGGVDVAVRDDYPLRTARWRAGDVPDGLVRCAGDRPGDVLLLRVTATQVHVAVRTADGMVHADAALRRVVARPGVPEWPIVAAWRAGERG